MSPRSSDQAGLAESELDQRPGLSRGLLTAIGVYVICVVFGFCLMAMFVASWLG